jgi:hypothetical protein
MVLVEVSSQMGVQQPSAQQEVNHTPGSVKQAHTATHTRQQAAHPGPPQGHPVAPPNPHASLPIPGVAVVEQRAGDTPCAPAHAAAPRPRQPAHLSFMSNKGRKRLYSELRGARAPATPIPGSAWAAFQFLRHAAHHHPLPLAEYKEWRVTKQSWRHAGGNRTMVLAVQQASAMLPALVWPMPLGAPALPCTRADRAHRVRPLQADNACNVFIGKPTSYTLKPEAFLRHGFSTQVLDWVTHGIPLPLASLPAPAHGHNYLS